MENENFIDDLFNQIDTQEESQKQIVENKSQQMLILQDQVKHDLLKFTRSLIRKAEAKNQLKDRVAEILMNRLTDEDQLENIGTQTLFRALEILNKGDNEFVGSILASLKSSASLNLNLDLGGGEGKNPPREINPSRPDQEINKDDFQAVKNVLNFLNKAKQSGEFSELINE